MIASLDLEPVAGATRTKQELLETISASRLGTWLSCRLKFYFRYLSGLPKKPSQAMRVGTVVHAVLQQWNLARWRKAPLIGDMVRTVFDQAWANADADEPIEWDDEEEGTKTSAFSLVETYLRDTPIPVEERPEGVEVSVEKDLAQHGLPKLVGIMDLVREGGRIVDFKTTSRTPDSEKVLHTTEVQTTTYAMLYREATDREESGIELHHLVRLKTPKLVVTQSGPASQQQLDRLLRMISSYVRGVEMEDFVPAPGMQCSSCEFFNECRAWR
jgi:CRISPR/Cas system-associated exonuclease Cas4 (RecB family)